MPHENVEIVRTICRAAARWDAASAFAFYPEDIAWEVSPSRRVVMDEVCRRHDGQRP